MCWDFAQNNQDYRTIADMKRRYRAGDQLDNEVNTIGRQVGEAEELRRLLENLRNHGCGAD